MRYYDMSNDWKKYAYYWRIIDLEHITYSYWHMFRPYNSNIFKIAMNSQYDFRSFWRGKYDF